MSKLTQFELRNTSLHRRGCAVLLRCGYIFSYTILVNVIVVSLKFTKNQPSLRSSRILSRPAHRVYLAKQNITGVGILGRYRNAGIKIISISRSPYLATNMECRLWGMGGEVLAVIA